MSCNALVKRGKADLMLSRRTLQIESKPLDRNSVFGTKFRLQRLYGSVIGGSQPRSIRIGLNSYFLTNLTATVSPNQSSEEVRPR
jgi:hypothetical protein